MQLLRFCQLAWDSMLSCLGHVVIEEMHLYKALTSLEVMSYKLKPEIGRGEARGLWFVVSSTGDHIEH